MTLWDKGAETDPAVLRFSAGREYELDARLVPYDVTASIAHLRMLGKIGVVSGEDVEALAVGLGVFEGRDVELEDLARARVLDRQEADPDRFPSSLLPADLAAAEVRGPGCS